MFTGIVEKRATVRAIHPEAKFTRIAIDTGWDDVRPGDSVAINGVCLTVAEIGPPGILGFDAIAETLSVTNLGDVQTGDEVNIERALRAGDRLDGHFVQGHVDGTAKLIEIVESPEEWRIICENPSALAPYMIHKGSVTIDGVSLTIAAVHDNRFEVALIPTTLDRTTLTRHAPGWRYNIETDIIARTVISHLQRQQG